MKILYFFIFFVLLQNKVYGEFNDPVWSDFSTTNPYNNQQYKNPYSTNNLGTNNSNSVDNILERIRNQNSTNPYDNQQYKNPYSTNNLSTNNNNSFNNDYFPDTTGSYGAPKLNTTYPNNQNTQAYSSSSNNNGGAVLFGILFWGMIIFFVIRAFSKKSDDNSSQYSVNEQSSYNKNSSLPIRSDQPYLNVHCTQKSERIPEQPDQTIDLIQVNITGQSFFPYSNYPITYRVRLVDVTESEHEPLPIICHIPELSDANGVFVFDIDAEAPYESVTFDSLELVNIPAEALVAPKKGQRRIKVLVGITPIGTTEEFYVDGATDINFIQQSYGWMEFQEAVAEQEARLAVLALCFASVNGNIGKQEAAIIKKYFSELYTNSDNADTRKQKVNDAMKETLSGLRNKKLQPRDVIRQICEEFYAEDSPLLSQQAYEICVRVSVADEKLEDFEEEMLALISGKLRLPEQFINEINERYITISTRQHNNESSVFERLGMPKNLTKEQKHEWIQTQYRKWKSRVTNKDPKLAAEASLMLGMLAKAKTQLATES